MTVELFRQRLTRAQLHPNDRQWMPTWLEQYATQQPPGIEALEVTEVRGLIFLRSLRDRGVPTWQRLQAARAVEWYQAMVPSGAWFTCIAALRLRATGRCSRLRPIPSATSGLQPNRCGAASSATSECCIRGVVTRWSIIHTFTSSFPESDPGYRRRRRGSRLGRL